MWGLCGQAGLVLTPLRACGRTPEPEWREGRQPCGSEREPAQFLPWSPSSHLKRRREGPLPSQVPARLGTFSQDQAHSSTATADGRKKAFRSSCATRHVLLGRRASSLRSGALTATPPPPRRQARLPCLTPHTVRRASPWPENTATPHFLKDVCSPSAKLSTFWKLPI